MMSRFEKSGLAGSGPERRQSASDASHAMCRCRTAIRRIFSKFALLRAVEA
jgi:hypothetical protein